MRIPLSTVDFKMQKMNSDSNLKASLII